MINSKTINKLDVNIDILKSESIQPAKTLNEYFWCLCKKVDGHAKKTEYHITQKIDQYVYIKSKLSKL